MEIDMNKTYKCVKPQGKPGERCGKQCVWFSVDNNKFVICKFFKLKDNYSIFKM